jgi:hypothetical protein
LSVCHRDPGVGAFGLHNVLMAVGDTFLEVVSPVREGTTAGRFLERRAAAHGSDAGARTGDGGYMVIVQSDDLVADRSRAEALGMRVVWDIALDDIAAFHVHPRDLGGAIVSLDQPHPPGAWRWAGPDWERATPSPLVQAISAAELCARDPAAMAARWAALLGRESRALGAGAHAIALDDSQLRFVPAPGELDELAAVELRAAPGHSGRELVACGVRFRLL